LAIKANIFRQLSFHRPTMPFEGARDNLSLASFAQSEVRIDCP
jgi:hypothetical protein